jgi:hypothetical protein
MDKNQLNIFRSAFKRANHGKISMPKRIDVSKIYDIEFYPNGMRAGYKVRFRIIKNDNQDYLLELFGGDDHSTWHKRIDHNGNITDLDNYKGQYGRTLYPEDPERTARENKEIQDFNETLHKLLIEKGLERNFENDEFEKTNVIVLRNYGF